MVDEKEPIKKTKTGSIRCSVLDYQVIQFKFLQDRLAQLGSLAGLYVYIHVDVCMYAYMYTHIYICMFLFVMFIYTYIHTYIHTQCRCVFAFTFKSVHLLPSFESMLSGRELLSMSSRSINVNDAAEGALQLQGLAL